MSLNPENFSFSVSDLRRESRMRNKHVEAAFSELKFKDALFKNHKYSLLATFADHEPICSGFEHLFQLYVTVQYYFESYDVLSIVLRKNK